MSLPILIVGGSPAGTDPALLHRLARSAGRVLAVDAGADLLLAQGIMPDSVVGDLDSLTPAAVDALRGAQVPFDVWAVDKDLTDLEIALAGISREECPEVWLTACSGARIDHQLAVLGAVARHADVRPVLREPGYTAWVLAPDARARVEIAGDGTTFSVLPVLGPAVVSVSGAFWPLERHELGPLSGHGVSNRVTDSPARISVLEGTALAIVPATPGS